MPGAEGQQIEQFLVGGVTLLAVTYALGFVVWWLDRVSPGASIGLPVAAAFALRVGAAAVVGLVGAEELRGSDEFWFLREASQVSETAAFSHAWIEALTRNMHEFVIAFQLRLFDSPDFALRVANIGIAVAGIALLAAAVNELAGRRAATLAAWLLAVEPTSVFYSGILHKEAVLLLASGVVAFGASKLWRGRGRRWLIAILLGCALAAATRPYAGVALFAAATLICLHAWIRGSARGRPRRLAVASSAAVLVVLGIAGAAWLSRGDHLESLNKLQRNARTGPSNLPLERVDYTTPKGVAVGVPGRIRDVLARPYPWQLGSTKQRLGLFGTLVALGVLGWLVSELVRARWRIMERAGPLVYIGVMLLLAYSVSAANAGTAFRHRTQIIVIAICLAVVLFELRAARRKLQPGGPATDRRGLAIAGAR